MTRTMGVIAMLLMSVVPVGWSTALADSVPQGGVPTGTFAPTATQGTPLQRRWTATSRTYAAPGGHLSTDIYPDDVNFKDSHGQYQAIDNHLVPSAASGYAEQNTANR